MGKQRHKIDVIEMNPHLVAMKPTKTSDMFAVPVADGGILGDTTCLILERAAMKKIICRRAGYYVDCRNCNVPVLYEDVAKRIVMERRD